MTTDREREIRALLERLERQGSMGAADCFTCQRAARELLAELERVRRRLPTQLPLPTA